MEQKGKSKRIFIALLTVIVFGLLLTSFRLQWIKLFNETGDHPVIVNGELDLREWDFSKGKTIPLNGEWAFYPYQLITSEDVLKQQEGRKMITVPGDWSETLNPQNLEPFGYGTYHLRILVNPNDQQAYGMQVPSVRSASALYVNGLLSGQSGQVGESEEETKAFNVPYLSSTIRADENGVIDILLQATNYADPRSSGLVRLIKFGDAEKIYNDSNLSMILQVTTSVVFIVFALFACILYAIGIRDSRMIYFAIVLVVISIGSLMGGDEKVLMHYLETDYTLTFKLSFSILIIFSWALLYCVKPQVQSLSKKLLPIYSVLSLIIIVIVYLLPMSYLNLSSMFSLSYVVISILLAAIALLFGQKNFTGSIWLALSCVALASHFGWWIYTLNTGLKVIYYPFDLILSVILFAGVWFKQYHEMHRETKQLAEELQKVDKIKDEFLVNTSHELRNPLHSILNISEAILERERETLEARSIKDLETVLAVSRRMSGMVNELLDLQQIEKGNPYLQMTPCSLQAIASGVIDMLTHTVEGKPVQIINDIPARFPLIVADEKRIIQILFNLLHNAVKFTNEGTIRIQAAQLGDEAQIMITDTGIGMEKSVIQSIFEPYVQGHQKESGGFGLGLNISRKLVELHGGKLDVQSILGEGSTFTFKVALANTEARDENLSRKIEETMETFQLHEQISAATEQETAYSQILVVDDDPVNLQVIKAMLDPEPYEIQTVLSGEEALRLLGEKEWDLIISDVMMPEISGYDLTKRVRERFSATELPILLLTARSESVDINYGFLVGANDYVTKPVDALEFKARVAALANIRKSMEERLQLEAEFLQAQIQPHFIFNALNTMMALSEIDLDRMRKVLVAFSQLLRGKFVFNELNQMTSIEKEIQLVESYLYIEEERFSDRLHVHWEIESDLNFTIPALMIQPLVENAIHHGIMKRPEGGSLTIQILEKPSYIEIIVEDDGVGMDPATLEKITTQTATLSGGIGLLNTDLRLKRKYGEGLQIKSTKGLGTIISFKIPK